MPQQPAMPSLGLSLVPVVALILLLAADVIAFGEDSSYGANQIAMLLAAFIAGGIGMARGVNGKPSAKPSRIPSPKPPKPSSFC